jgi:thiamine transporter
MENSRKPVNTRALVTSGVFIAASFVLSYLKLFTMPQGGSVTFASMLPVLLIGLLYGPGWGLGAGLVYGLLQYVQDGYALTPVNILLDYLVAFGALGLTGFFKTGKYRFYIGCAVSVFVRFVCHYLSGIVFYASYAPEGQPVWLYSLIYNGPFLLVDLIVALVVGTFLLRSVPQFKHLLQ